MKTIFKVMFLLCTIGLVPSVAKAQEKVIIDDEASNGIVMVTIDKAGDEIVRIMNESQFRYIHDPQAPRFLLMDKKGKFALGIGGYVRATAEYDFGGIVDNMDFIPAYIPNASIDSRQRTIVCTEPVPDGCKYFHHLPETGRTHKTTG